MKHISFFVAAASAALFPALLSATPESAQKDLASFAPESKNFKLVYAISPLRPDKKLCVIDKSADFAGKPVKKLAYYLILTGKDGKISRVFVTMDAFTQNVKEAGIPTFAKSFQTKVTNMTVKSDVKDVKNGTSEGFIEFWAYNYGANNADSASGASNSQYDFNDTKSENGNYGCMQIHNPSAKQTVMALNHWVASNCDLGIGNNPTGQPDWTFANNGSKYQSADLLILAAE